MFTVVFTGSRNYSIRWKPQETVMFLYRREHGRLKILVGDCPTGLDEIVKGFCITAGIEYKEFKANWNKYGKAAGPKRNHKMVDSEHIDLCVAFPLEDSRGTKDCAQYAHDKEIEVWFPDMPDWAQWAAPIGKRGYKPDWRT